MALWLFPELEIIVRSQINYSQFKLDNLNRIRDSGWVLDIKWMAAANIILCKIEFIFIIGLLRRGGYAIFSGLLLIKYSIYLNIGGMRVAKDWQRQEGRW